MALAAWRHAVAALRALSGLEWVSRDSPALPPPRHGARRCNDEQQTVVEVQSQLRLGRSDFGVNARRNERFLVELSQAFQAGLIPEGACLPDNTAAG